MEPGTIDVRLHELEQLFNSMDPSPFYEKELNPEAEEFILSAARGLPGQPVTIRVHVERVPDDPDAGRTIRNAIRRHFARRAQQSRQAMKSLLRSGRISLLIGLGCLAASFVGADLLGRIAGPPHLLTILRESLTIGGWVAMWHPMQIFLDDWWPIRDERRLFERLSRSEVQLNAAGQPTRVGPDSPNAEPQWP